MAIVVNQARPAPSAVERATEEFTQPTDAIAYDNAFTIKQSVVDGHVRTRRNSGGVNVSTPAPQSAYPIVGFNGFWHDVNTPSTGPSITSITIIPPPPRFVGDTLTAVYSVYPGEPPATATFEWLLDGVPIVGATAETYLTVVGNAGHDVSVRITLDNVVTDPVTATSASAVIIGAPTVVGGSPFAWDESEDTGVQTHNAAQYVTVLGDIPQDTVTWTMIDDAGGLVTVSSITGLLSVNTDTSGLLTNEVVIARATNDIGSVDVTLTLNVAIVVTAPTNVALPMFTGDGIIGNVQTGNAGLWSGNPTPTLSYKTQKWNGAAWVDIVGAVALNYTPVEADDTDDIRLLVTATNTGGSLSIATTPAIAVTYNAPIASASAFAWSVPLGDPPQTLDAKPFFTVAIGAGFDTDRSGMTGLWGLTSVPGSGGVAFVDGVFAGGVFVAATGPDVDLSIDADGIITLSYAEALVDVSFGVVGANSGGNDEKTITVNTTDAWSILDVPGLFAYWDTNVLSSLWADTAGTVPATVGNEVARRNDLSGNGRNQIWTAAGSAPTLEIDGNGKYYLNFADGTVDRMTVAGVPVPLGINRAKYAAVQRGTQVGTFNMCRSIGNLNAQDYFSFVTASSGRIQAETRVLSSAITAVLTAVSAINAFDNSAPRVLSAYLPANPGAMSLKVNNVAAGTVTSPLTTTYGTTVSVNAHAAGTNQPVNFRNYAQAEFSAIPGASDDLEIINLMATACGVSI